MNLLPIINYRNFYFEPLPSASEMIDDYYSLPPLASLSTLDWDPLPSVDEMIDDYNSLPPLPHPPQLGYYFGSSDSDEDSSNFVDMQDASPIIQNTDAVDLVDVQKNEWVCPDELKDDPSEFAAFTRKVLEEG